MKIQDQVVLGQNPQPVISTTTKEFMANKSGSPRVPAQEAAAQISRYRAPALEKGLDVLELLAAEKSPLNLSAISQRLGRSSGELFRMLQVLEFKGFITTAENGTGYVLTNKLFALAMAQAPVRSLVETALPIMRKLVKDIGQSAHIAVASEDQIVVITRIERPGDLGFSVRIGYRREIASATSGLVLFAYQNDEVRRSGSNGVASRATPPIPSSSAPTSYARVAITKPRRTSCAGSSTCPRRSCAATPQWRRSPFLSFTAIPSRWKCRRQWSSCARPPNRSRARSCTETFHDRDDERRQRAPRLHHAGISVRHGPHRRLFFMWGVANSLNDVLIPAVPQGIPAR
jgi:DNA-binding IclR family transcriptional regulator